MTKKGIARASLITLTSFLMLGSIDISTAQGVGTMVDGLTDASTRVDPLGLALIGLVLISIIYFGGGVWDRRAERKARNEEWARRIEVEKGHAAARSQWITDLRGISERDDEYKRRIQHSVGVMANVITRNNELLIEHEQEAKSRETTLRAALEIAGKRAEERYKSVQEQISIDSAANMRGLAEALGKSIVEGQKEFSATFARTFAEELPKYLEPLFSRMQSITVTPHHAGLQTVTIDARPVTGQLTPPPDTDGTDKLITDPDDPQAKG